MRSLQGTYVGSLGCLMVLLNAAYVEGGFSSWRKAVQSCPIYTSTERVWKNVHVTGKFHQWFSHTCIWGQNCCNIEVGLWRRVHPISWAVGDWWQSEPPRCRRSLITSTYLRRRKWTWGKWTVQAPVRRLHSLGEAHRIQEAYKILDLWLRLNFGFMKIARKNWTVNC